MRILEMRIYDTILEKDHVVAFGTAIFKHMVFLNKKKYFFLLADGSIKTYDLTNSNINTWINNHRCKAVPVLK